MNRYSSFLRHHSSENGSVPTREQVDVSDTWDLSALYESDDAWEKDFRLLEIKSQSYTAYKGKVTESAASLQSALEFDREISILTERLYHYASLRNSEDASNNANLQRMGRLENLMTRIGEMASFLTPELQAMDDATFEAYLKNETLAAWHTMLKKLRRFKPHTLSEKEERLLALGDNAMDAARQIFSQLTNVDMRFGQIEDENRKTVELSHGAFSSFLVKRDPELRRKAFHQYYAEFDDHKFTLAAALSNSVKADVFQARAKNYPSARESSLFPDKVPVAVYDNLIETVHQHLDTLYRYFELRKRILKLDEIHHYDTYVPMVGEIEKHTSWNEAVELVIRALSPLGSEYTSTLEAGLLGRWCDRYETKGKRSGAFSSSSYGNPPYILMNYKADVFSDVYTLAHEGGHSMHSWYSQKHQSFQDYNYPIFTAEVASTFNEELITHYLLSETNDPKLRAYIINRQIDDIRGTLFRQTMFAEFEKIIHAMEESGETPTLAAFRSEYRKLLNLYFGKDFAIDTILELECLRIPHFYSAFYVYKYATGISAAISLSQKVLNGTQSDVDAYLGFLKSGGSRYPIDTLQSAGVDMAQPAPVCAALELFTKRVAELETLL